MIFKPAARYPADPRAVFILALSIFSGLTALALSAAPPSLEALLPSWAVVIWGAALILGSAITLTGMMFQSVNGIIAEQVGSVTVGVAAVFYSGMAVYAVGPDAIQIVAIILGWGLACFVRWGQLQVLIHDALKRKQKIELLAHLDIELKARDLLERKHGTS
jgi:hypothetical protein